MSDRRFTDKPDIDSSAVMSLTGDHAAMIENRTLFPSTVVTVTATIPDRLLISGVNNRKLGKTVEKGRFAGYGLYQLSLEERATCPRDCDARAFCYGNGMQLARRHRIGDAEIFYARLEEEIKALAKAEKGILIRLHVLGDFPSVEYVAFWLDILATYENVACFGYTHRLETALDGDDIGDAIASIKSQYPDRFRIRWSFPVPLYDGATITDGTENFSDEEVKTIACPAQADATACCATCSLCWETSDNAIMFLKHGRSIGSVAAAAAQPIAGEDNTRPIAPIPLPKSIHPAKVVHTDMDIRSVFPTELRIEATYQRDLTGKSISLIRKIVTEWDWAKFKPPICAETESGLFVVDGQHTAIAAASHPSIEKIPVVVVSRSAINDRAGAFVSHNRDRLAMSPFQILHAEAVAGGKQAIDLLAVVERAGAFVPRCAPIKGRAKPGEIVCVSAIQRVFRTQGVDCLGRIIRIAVAASCAPITTTVIFALAKIVHDPHFASVGKSPDTRIADALHGIKNFERAAQALSSDLGVDRYRAGAELIASSINESAEMAA